MTSGSFSFFLTRRRGKQNLSFQAPSHFTHWLYFANNNEYRSTIGWSIDFTIIAISDLTWFADSAFSFVGENETCYQEDLVPKANKVEITLE